MSKRGQRMSNGNKPGLSASTTIPMGVAAVVIIAMISGAWWAASLTASLSLKVDSLKDSAIEIKADVNNLKNDVNSIKFDLSSVKSTVTQINTETRKK